MAVDAGLPGSGGLAWRDRLVHLVLRPTTPPLAWGIVVAAVLIAVEMLVVHLLEQIAPNSAFGAVFLFGVLVVSAGWRFGLAVATSVVSAVAYAYVHVSENSESLIPAVVVFSTLALLTNVLVGQARLRATESEQRRCEADLLADLARTVLRAEQATDVLSIAGERLTAVLDLPPPYAVLELPGATVGPGQRLVELRDGDAVTGSLLVPAELSQADVRRVRRVVPALEALFAAALDREALHRRTLALARQQAALRRTATLVALRGALDEVYAAVVHEIADGVGAEHVSLVRFDNEGGFTVLAARDDGDPTTPMQPGEQLRLGGHNVCTAVHATGAAVTIDWTSATGPVAERLRGRGLLLGTGVPVNVEGSIWGALVIAAADRAPAQDVEARLTDFADLVATAVHDSRARAQLTASRARVVAAADQARRLIERDLHDGVQQRIVSLGMDLRATQSAVDVEPAEVRRRLDRHVDALAHIHTALQELSRGIHPAILSRGGLGAALKTLARRSPVPVALSVTIPTRLPEAIEVAAYYVVAEALTNAAKYAGAEEVTVAAVADESGLELVVADDGVGGADTGGGSGLLGLQDRVEAVGGTLSVSSPLGGGTTLTARVPVTPVSTDA